MPPTSLSVAGVHCFPFIISANNAKRTEITLPSSASPLTDSLRKSFWSFESIRRILREPAECPTKCHQDLSGVVQVEEINGCRVLPFQEADLQIPHEPSRRHPEIIPHQHNRLNMLAIAVTKSGDQFCVLLAPFGMKPLLELIEDQQHLPLRWQDATPSQVCQRVDQTHFFGQFLTRLAQALEQAGFGLFGGRFDVYPQNMFSKPWKKSRFHQRRLPTTRRSVDQPQPERQVGVDLLDLSFPKPNAVRQTISVTWSGKQFQEEVGILLIEGPQPFGDDLDRSLIRIGLPGVGQGRSGLQC